MNAHWRPFSVYFGLIRNFLVSLLFTLFLALPSLAQDFTARSIGDYGNVTVMEVSGNYDSPDLAASNTLLRQLIGKEFFKTHKDEYDFLVIFSNFDFIMPEFETLAFYNPVKNDIRYIGQKTFNNSSYYGSNGRLQGTIDMGNIAANVSDPLNPKFDNTLNVLAHEFLHRWGSYVKFKDWNGAVSTKLLGQDGSHWSFLLDTKGSLEYGNQWQDNGNGTFTSVGTGKKFSPLDLYLMGMIDKSEVPPMLLIENDSVDHTRLPEPGVTISGTARKVTIDEIIAAEEGERFPSAKDSQKQFKTAFIFITSPGSFTGQELGGIENIRNGFLTRFSILTDGKALVQVASTPKEDLPLNPGVRPPTTTPRTLPPNVEDGVRWLTEHQLSDGSWTDFALTTERDTAETVSTLQRFPVAQQQFQAGLAWLAGNASANTDFLARRLEAAAQTGGDAAALVSELLFRRNTDGGWGSGRNFTSNPTDTALALKALARSGYADQQVIGKAITYLKSAQKSDGGWSGDDTVSMIQPSAAVLTAFNAYRKSYSLEENIGRAVTFLTGKQNADGGFGNSPSTVYDSALAVMALQESGADKEMINRGVGYLNGLQTGDGSWEGSPFQTALAVRAVWQASVDPDLSVDPGDIIFIPERVTTLPTDAVVNAVIRNLGRSDVPQVKVALYKDAVAPENTIGEQVVAAPGMSPVTVTFSVPITDGAGHSFFVVVDPDNLVKEPNKNNNSTAKALLPEATYDLEVLAADLAVSPNPVEMYQEVRVSALIANRGTMNAYSVPVRFFIDESGTPVEIATATVDIPAGGTVTKEVTWKANKTGVNLPVTVQADPYDAVAEIREDNNKLAVPLTVNGSTMANLTVSYKDVVATPNPANERGSTTISAVVKNDGFSAAENFKVSFYLGAPNQGGVLLGSQVVTALLPQQSVTTAFEWKDIAESGARVISVVLDPDNAVQEISEDDNFTYTSLMILTLPDLAISSTSIALAPAAPKTGDQISVSLTVQNRGEQDATNVVVRVTEGETTIGSVIIPIIHGNSQATAVIPYLATYEKGTHRITAVVDPEQVIAEGSEENNAAAKEFAVQDASLWVSEPYFSPNGDGIKDTTDFSFRLDAANAVTVAVVDKKGERVRTFSGGLENTQGSVVTWDGKNDDGVVEGDGAYQFQVLAANNSVVGSLAVILDTNRSPMSDAIGSKFSHKTSYPAGLPGYDKWQWLPEEKGIILTIKTENEQYHPGLYLMAPDGGSVICLTPREWADDPANTYTGLYDYQVSSSGDQLAFVLRRQFKDRTTDYYSTKYFSDEKQLILIDLNTYSMTVVESEPVYYKLYRNWLGNLVEQILQEYNDLNSFEWAPDGRKVLYQKIFHHMDGVTPASYQLWLYNVSDVSKRLVSSTTNWVGWPFISPDGGFVASYGSDNNGKFLMISNIENGASSNLEIGDQAATISFIKWSDSGSKLVYSMWNNERRAYTIMIADRSGTAGNTFVSELPEYYSPEHKLEWLANDKLLLTQRNLNSSISPTDLYIINPEVDGAVTKVGSDSEGAFSVSPDKKLIAFVDSNHDLKLSDLTGNVTTVHSSIDGSWLGPVVWAPDGGKVAFHATERTGKWPDFFYHDFNAIFDIHSSKTTKFEETVIYWDYYRHNRNHELKWDPTGQSIVSGACVKDWEYYWSPYTSCYDLELSDSITGATFKLEPGEVSNGFGFSPVKGNLTNEKLLSTPHNIFSLSSTRYLANLTAELNIANTSSALSLHGTAQDLNFDGYKLEYADAANPGVWNLILPPSDQPVVSSAFATWVPPGSGSFFVRLTVWDKAGNTAHSKKRITWGKPSTGVSSLYKTRDFISPNGDGVNESAELHYKAQGPIHLEFNVLDPDGNALRTFVRDYASAADDFISWDGRDESGNIVADGRYKIKVFDYEFFVEVDTEAPKVGINIGQMQFDDDKNLLYADLSGLATDSNIKSWKIEYGVGDNPQEWHHYWAGNDVLVDKDNAGTPLTPVQATMVQRHYDQNVALLNDRKFRIMAEDFAGNTSTAISGFAEEKVILSKWDDTFVIRSLNDIYSTAEVPAENAGTNHAIKGFSTLRAPAASTVLQYWNGKQWLDTGTSTSAASGLLEFAWDSSFSGLGAGFGIRVKVVDTFGGVHYSNTLTTADMFSLEYTCTSHPLVGQNLLFDSLKLLKLQVISGQDANYSNWTDYHAYDAAKGDSIPTGLFIPPLPNMKSDVIYYVRMVGTGANGQLYEGHSGSFPSSCPLELSLELTYDEAKGCGEVAPGMVSLAATAKNSPSNISLKTLSYYLQTSEGLLLLEDYDIVREGWRNYVLPTSGLAEGTHAVKAVLSYHDLNDNKVKSAEATATLTVDRVLPAPRVTYPGGSPNKVCPVKAAGSAGAYVGIPVEGVVADNLQVKRYELYYGNGENPSEWLPAMAPALDLGTVVNRHITGSKAMQGTIGTWNTAGLAGGIYSVKLKVIDGNGNVSCATNAVSLDSAISIPTISADRLLFSPNGDGVTDEVKLNFQTDKDATVVAKVFKMLAAGGLDVSPVRVLASGTSFTAGAQNLFWDGKTDAGTPASDGRYGMAVSATDSCGNTTTKWAPVEVDQTPPTAVISYPKLSDTLPPGNIIEVSGTAAESHFASYTLEAGEGENPTVWTTVSSGASKVDDALLGAWNTYGRIGKWVLRLSALDTVGNKSSTISSVDLGTRKSLIKTVEIAPNLFSPNQDGKGDTVVIGYELAEACKITVDILDSTGTVVRTFAADSATAGSNSFRWDGKNSAATMAADGRYLVKLTASLLSNPASSQTESLSVVVDTTLPQIDIKQPANRAYLNASKVSVTGTITDQNLLGYAVNVTGPAGSVIQETGTQSRTDFTFWEANDVAEGDYVIVAEGNDKGDNSTRVTRSFTIDRTAPKSSLAGPKSEEFYGAGNRVISVTGSLVEENLELFSLRYGIGEAPAQWQEMSGGTTVGALPETHAWKVGKEDGVADGLYTISLYAKDKAGQEGESRVKVTVDNTPPTVAFASIHDGDYIRGGLDITGDLVDANLDKAFLELAEGGCAAATRWSTLKSFTTSNPAGVLMGWKLLPADGDYCLKLSATDKAGNKASVTAGIRISTHPPAAPSLAGEISNKTSVLLTWPKSVEPDVSGYNLYRDGQKVNAALLTDLSYTDGDLKDGFYAYTLTAVNEAGGESSVSAAVKLRIDTLGPDARLSVQPGAMLHDLVELKGTTYSADDFKEYRLYVGQGQNPSAWSLIRKSPLPVKLGSLAELDTTVLPDGAHALKLEAEDLTGNVTQQTVAVMVDNTPPTAPVLLSVSESGNAVTITWTASPEPEAGYLLYRNDQLVNSAGMVVTNPKPYLVTGTSYLDQALPDGKYMYYLVAVDPVGNIGNVSNSISATIDMHAPHATITEPMNHSEFEHRLVVKAEAADIDVASVQFQYKRVQDDTWIYLGEPVTSTPFLTYLDPALLGLAHGDFQLQCVATDTGGKRDPAPSSITATYTDLTPPAVPSGLRAAAAGNAINLDWSVDTEADGGYAIYRASGMTVTRLTGSGPRYQDLDLADGTYSYTIAALDSFGNESEQSGSVSVTIYAPVLAQPYSPVTQPSSSITGSGAAPYSTVQLMDTTGTGDTSVGNAVADAEGGFRFDDVILLVGRNSLTALATDSAGNVSRASDAVVVVYSQPPAKPMGLAATVEGYAVSLAWDATAESDVAGYNVYRDGVKLNVSAIASGEATASAYAYDAGLASDGNDGTVWWSKYSYGQPFIPAWWQMTFPTVELINHLEIHWYDNVVSYAGKDFEVQAWTGDAWIPLAKVNGNALKDNSFNFNPPSPASKIRIAISETNYPNSDYRRVAIAEIKILKETPMSINAYQDAGLLDRRYTYTVSAINDQGLESQPSDAVMAEVGDLVAPAVPQGLTAVVTGSSALLSWSQNGETGIKGYNIYRISRDAWRKVNVAEVNDVTFSDVNLVNGTYRWRVTAVDKVGNESEPSSEASSTIAVGSPPPPGQPRIVAPQEGKTLVLSWDASEGTTAGYVLYRSTTTGGPYQLMATVTATDLSYVDSGLVNGTAYYYVVSARDLIGNESQSSEAFGVPIDVVAPGIPQVIIPVSPGGTAIVYSGSTDVAGIAEPGVTVELFKDNVAVGKAVASTSETIAKVHVASGYSPVPSPDGSLLAYMENSYLIVMELPSGTAEKIVADGWGAKWSADGKTLCFKYMDGSYTRVGIYDVEAKRFRPLTDHSAVSEDMPSLSRDGSKIAYTSNKNSSQHIWVKDLLSGIETETGFNGTTPTISPDGDKISYYNGKTLVVADLTDGSTQQINNTDGSNFAWSPSGESLLYQSYRDSDGIRYLYVRDVETENEVQITTDGLYCGYLAWSPDGQRVAFGKYDNPGMAVFVMDMEGQARKVSPIGNLTYLAWGRNGTLTALDGNARDILTVRPQGQFIFNDVSVVPGENFLSVTASDETGNTSGATDPVNVVYDASMLPDIVVSSDSVYIFPIFPKPGEDVTVNAVVSNIGSAPVDNVDVELYLWNSDGKLQLVGSETIPHIEGNSNSEVAVRLNAGITTGTQSLIVSVDPGSKIDELSKFNNTAVKDFYVTDKDEVTVSASLDYEQYRSGQDATVTVAVNNSGNGREGIVEVIVEDAAGYKVASLAAQAGVVPYGISTSTYKWNSGSTLAGSYRVHAMFSDVDQRVIESSSSFTILADEMIEASLTSDRQIYGANESVQLNCTAKNNGSNYIVSVLAATVRIVDSNNTEIYALRKNLENLFPTTVATFPIQWNTGISIPGKYRAIADAYLDEKRVSSSTVEFVIEPVSAVTGTVSVAPVAVPIGSRFNAAATLSNSGNIPAGGALKAVVIKPETGVVVASAEKQVQIPVSGSTETEFQYFSESLSLGTYQVRMYYLSQGTEKAIGSAFIAVKDFTAPALSVIAPVQGTIYNSTVRLEVMATDDASGIESVEYQLDGGAWKTLALVSAAQWRYATAWEPGASELPAHTVSFRATDRSGNLSTPVSVSFKVQMDNTAPVTTIDIEGPRYEVDDKLYVSPATVFTLAACDDFSGVANTEYRIDGGAWTPYAPFRLTTAGGATIYYRSVDSAGNPEQEKSLKVYLDKDAPTTTIMASDPLAAGVVNTVSPKTVFTLTATDTGTGIKQIWYRIDDGQWLLVNEGFTLDGKTAGSHTIQFNALDNVANEEAKNSVTVRLIRVEVEKDTAPEPVVLVGAWTDNLNRVKNQGAIEAVKPILSSLGVDFWIAQDGEEFKTALRSGKYNSYLLIDYKDEKTGGELREAVNYGDSFVYIKTKPGADPSLEDVFGMKLTGETTSEGIPVILAQSPLTAPVMLQSSGKCVVGSVVAGTASVFGYADDRRGQVPAVVYNEYGEGRAVLFTFDLLNSSNKADAAQLLGDAVKLVTPDRKAHALGTVPIEITVANSTEPVRLRIKETFPAEAVARDITPEGAVTEAAITWLQDLDPSVTMKYRYYLDLPDTKGEYKAVTEISYANHEEYRLYEAAELTLTVGSDSSDLLGAAISDLGAVPDATSDELVILAELQSRLSQINVKPLTVKDAEKEIESLTRVTDLVRGVSADTANVRLKLDELLKVLERKWYLLSTPGMDGGPASI